MKNPNSLTKILFEECDRETDYLLAFQEIDSCRLDEIQALTARASTGLDNDVLKIDDRMLAKLRGFFHIEPQFSGVLFQLRITTLSEELPYLSHTDRELALMRVGRKPLSIFSGIQISDLERSIYFRLFDPLVEEGLFTRAEYQFSTNGRLVPGSRLKKNFALLYALKGHEWRIDTYRMLRDTVAHTGTWSDDYERLLGTLLGYSDKENDAWLRRRAARGLRWGYATLYMALPVEEVPVDAHVYLRRVLDISGETVDLFVSEEGVEPVLERLNIPNGTETVYFARFYIPYRNIRDLYGLTRNTTQDQFGPFTVERDKLVELAELKAFLNEKAKILTVRRSP